MRLAVVIPVWNDEDGLRRLMGDLAALAVVGEVVVVDDGSDPPCSPERCLPAGGLPGVRLVWQRTPATAGAGHARNRGLEAVTCPHVLFFDADDRLRPEFAALLADLDGREFDFAIFRHADSRVIAEGGEGPLEPDGALWRRAGAGPAPALLEGAGRLALCRVSAYPWNKVYRTAFLREAAIRCTEIPVHNDLELHWASFIAADRVLASSRIGCLHAVSETGRHLTHRRDADRLRVFEALANVVARLRATEGASTLAEPFVEFCLRLFAWIPARLEDRAARAEFERRAGAFLAGLGADFLTLALLRNPALAAPALRHLRARA
ncbi:MAG: glycosyltransferase [Rhodobacteraceae bacterium]|nr:glycosyltransferase [Paracoccaceae bacterium]